MHEARASVRASAIAPQFLVNRLPLLQEHTRRYQTFQKRDHKHVADYKQEAKRRHHGKYSEAIRHTIKQVIALRLVYKSDLHRSQNNTNRGDVSEYKRQACSDKTMICLVLDPVATSLQPTYLTYHIQPSQPQFPEAKAFSETFCPYFPRGVPSEASSLSTPQLMEAEIPFVPFESRFCTELTWRRREDGPELPDVKSWLSAILSSALYGINYTDAYPKMGHGGCETKMTRS